MVANKSNKAAKYTYAERVLGAFSQVQRDHRKHAVHLATLRAQVRKTAQVKKDKLGPQWASWVGKAVHKLEDEGILQAALPTGNVTLTPNGKKVIAVARHDLSLSATASPTPAQEDMIWKQVSHPSGRGLKRKQPLQPRTSKSAGTVEDDEEEREVLSVFKKKNGSKKARTSTNGGRTPLSKMTKAELRTELQSLQKAHSEALDSLSVSYEADTDEARLLRAELETRQQEIGTIRNELTQLKRTAAGIIHHEDESSSQPMTPEATMDPATSSPIRPNRANVLARSRPLLVLTRTQSGSFISDLSKQPTPAPSSPGVDHNDALGYDHDVFGIQADNTMDTYGHITVETRPHALLTPESTPSRADVSRETELTKEVQMYKALADELKRKSEIGEKALQDKIASLESNLNVNASEFQNLEAKYTRLSSEQSKLEETISDRNSHIKILQTDIHSFRMSDVQKTDEISFRDSRISELEATDANTKQLIASQMAKIAELQNSLRDNESSKLTLVQEKEKQIGQLERAVEEWKNLQRTTAEELASMTTRNAALGEKLQSAEGSKLSLSVQLRVALEDNAATAISLARALASIESLTTQSTNSGEELLKVKSHAEELQIQLSAAQLEAQNLRAEVGSLSTSVGALSSELESSNIVTGELRSKLSDFEDRQEQMLLVISTKDTYIANLETAKDEVVSEVALLSEETTELRSNLSQLQASLDATVGPLQKGREDVAQLSRDLSDKERERMELGTRLSSVEAARDRFAAKIKEKDSEIDALRSEVSTVGDNLRRLQTALDRSNEKAASDSSNYEGRISSLVSSLDSAQGETRDFKSQLNILDATRTELGLQLAQSRAGVIEIRSALDATEARASALQKDLLDAIARAQDAEEDLASLKESKVADELTIEALKDGYSRLRKIQLDSLAELDNKVVSAHSSPLPKRRRTSTRSAELS